MEAISQVKINSKMISHFRVRLHVKGDVMGDEVEEIKFLKQDVKAKQACLNVEKRRIAGLEEWVSELEDNQKSLYEELFRIKEMSIWQFAKFKLSKHKVTE